MLAALLYDAATEGGRIILSMLVVGLIFIAVIALGELTHWLGERRRARRRGQRAY